MSTDINISIGGNNLTDKVKAQQRAARLARITGERLDRQTQDDATRTRAAADSPSAARATPLGAALLPATPSTGRPARFRLPDPAATRLNPLPIVYAVRTRYTAPPGFLTFSPLNGSQEVTVAYPPQEVQPGYLPSKTVAFTASYGDPVPLFPNFSYGTSQGSLFRQQLYGGGNLDERMWELPAGGDKVILFIRLQRVTAIAGATWTWEESREYTPFIEPDTPENGTRTIASTYTPSFFGSSISTEYYAFLVSDTQVKTLTVPQTLINLIENYSLQYTITASTPSSTTETVTGATGNVFDFGIESQMAGETRLGSDFYSFNFEQLTYGVDSINGTVSSSGGTYTKTRYSTPSYEFAITGTLYDPSVANFEIRGIGSTNFAISSPSIFTSIALGREVEDENTTVPFLIETYMQDVPLPDYSTTAKLVNTDNGVRVDFDLQRGLFPDQNTEKFRNNRQPLLPLTLADGVTTYNYYTDWARPVYCRTQCLALGFTSEDLIF
jgi:hypothetical protein